MIENEKIIEIVRNYWDHQPCNIKHSKKEVGTIEYFNEVERRKYFVESHIPKFADFPYWTGKKVLEIGCGIGTDAVQFARHGAFYTGLEISKVSLELCRKRFEVFNLAGNFIEGNVENLDDILEGQSFDLIYSFGVLHHTPTIEKALNSLKKFMNENSTLKIMVYAKNSIKQALINSGIQQPEAQSNCPIANSYTKEDIINLFEKIGLEILELKQTHIFPYKISEYKKYEYVKEEWIASMPEAIFETLEKNFGWHMLINSKLRL